MDTQADCWGVELDERHVQASDGAVACGAREGVGRHIAFASSSVWHVDTTHAEQLVTVPTVPDHSKPPAKRRRRSVGGFCPELTANAPSTGQGELVIMGVGIKAMCHITHEAMVCLKAADVVFSGLDATGPDRRWLEMKLRRPVLDLNQFYPRDPQADRAQCYVRSASAVLQQARAGRRVALAVTGHPTVCDATTELLVRVARSEQIAVRVLPGVSCVATLMAELGVEPSSGMLVCTAQTLLDAPCAGGGIRGAIGPALKHLVVLMPDAAGDNGTGARVATGEVSLADSPAFLQLLTILADAYGQSARCVLYRAPVWASVNHASMLSIPLPSLRCRSFVDPLVRAWGGDLGTMYVPGAPTHTPPAHVRPPAAQTTQAATEALTATQTLVGGFDAKRSDWLRRWGCVDVADSSKGAVPSAWSSHTPVDPAAAIPPECGFAVHAPCTALTRFDTATAAQLGADCSLAEAHQPEVVEALQLTPSATSSLRAQQYLAARAACEPSDAAVALQAAFARGAGAVPVVGETGCPVEVSAAVQAVASASQLYGQLALSDGGSGGAAHAAGALRSQCVQALMDAVGIGGAEADGRVDRPLPPMTSQDATALAQTLR